MNTQIPEYNKLIYVEELHLTLRREAWDHILCNLMSEASEQLWAAGWFMDLEYLLPTLSDQKKSYLSYNLYETMEYITDALGYWVDIYGNPVV